MSDHWRLALRNAAWIVALAVPVGVAMFLVYGEGHAGALYYGVGVGTLSLVSMALTVSLLTNHSNFLRVVGAASFVARYAFVAVALGVPGYLESWPIMPMLAGFAGVYLTENVVLLPGMMKMMSKQGVQRDAERRVRGAVERRVET